jgi:hypothetical protein
MKHGQGNCEGGIIVLQGLNIYIYKPFPESIFLVIMDSEMIL